MKKKEKKMSEGAKSADAVSLSLSDELDRRRFASKVFGILTLQMFVASLIVLVFCVFESVREWLYDRIWTRILPIMFAAGFYLPLAFLIKLRRRYPTNLVLLVCFSFFLALSMGIVAASYEHFTIFYAYLTTAAVVFVMTLLARFAPCDITGCGIVFLIALLALIIFGCISWALSLYFQVKNLHIIFAGIFVVVSSMYIMFVTQLIIGGRICEMNTDEYLLAVIILYTTVMEIFMHLLSLIGACFES